VLKRRSYGVKNLGNLFRRICLDLRGYEAFAHWQHKMWGYPTAIPKDPLFGPCGVWAEALDDVSVRLAPLSAEEGLAMLADIRCQRFFDGLGSCPPVDRRALADLLARVSRWVAASPWLAELDLNPVIANDEGFHVVDARLRVSFGTARAEALEMDPCM
jgi:ATP-grasp domain